jgi:hypothetical protein
VIVLGRKNISRGKNKSLSDFSYLINKPEDTEEDKTNKIEESKEKEE